MTDPSTPKQSKEETAFYIKAFWDAMLAPKWLRDDLIELGKAVYAKEPLATLDDALFARLMPHLVEMANVLGAQIAKKFLENDKRCRPIASPAVSAPPDAPVEKEEKDG
jgi:hypothetical protein